MTQINEYVLYWYITGLAMIFPHFINMLLLQRRSRAVLRFISSIVFCLGVSYIALLLPVSMLTFAILHIAAILSFIWCCRLRPEQYVYYVVWGITFYYLAEQMSAVLASLFDQYNQLPIMYLYKGIGIAVSTGLQLWIIISVRKRGADSFQWRQVILSVLICGSVVAINIVSFSQSGQQGLFVFMFQFFSMLVVVLMLYMQVLSQDSNRRQNEAEFYRYLWRSSQKNYDMKKAYLDMINHKYHDMKHEIRALRQMEGEERQGRLDRLEQMIDGYQNLYQTGNEALDIILNDKRRECENRDILLTCTANVNQLEFIDLVDLHILLGNLFDNAVEAVVSLPKGKRIIDFKIYNEKRVLRIYEANYFEGDLQYAQDKLISNKGQDGTYHGFGTQSMQYIIDRYHGEMQIDAKEQIFRLHIMIPCDHPSFSERRGDFEEKPAYIENNDLQV